MTEIRIREVVVDVVVVGAGPSGSVVSHTLAAKGFSVVCLEQGDWVNPSDFPGNRPDFELLIQPRWSHDPNVRRLAANYPLNITNSDTSPVTYNAVGGGSVVYGANWHRLTPGDFRVGSVDGVAADRPLSYADLVPYYEAIDTAVGVSGLEGDPAYPARLKYARPPLPLGPAGRRAANAANSLGWHWWPGSQAIANLKHGHLEGCARLGVCEWGCPQGAKASFDRAYWPAALQSGARLVTGARVRHVCTDSKGRANGVEWVDREGREQMLRARAVVLCANGIGTARLLLLSATGTQPQGLSNSSGLVGRNLMLHPNCIVTGFYDEPLDSWMGPAGELVYSLQFYETDTDRGFARDRNEPLPRGWAVNEVGENTSDPATALSGALLPAGGPKGFGLAFMLDCLIAIGGSATGDRVGAVYGDPTKSQHLGHLLVAMRVDAVRSAQEYSNAIGALETAVHSSGTPGSRPPLVPGEPERDCLTEDHWTADPVTVQMYRSLSIETAVPQPATSLIEH